MEVGNGAEKSESGYISGHLAISAVLAIRRISDVLHRS